MVIGKKVAILVASGLAVAAAIGPRQRRAPVDKLPADPATTEDVIGDLIPDGNGGVWAMGFTPSNCAGPMWHESAGTWTDTGVVGCSVGAYVHGPQGLANVPGTTSVWGVGGQFDPNVPNDEAGLVLLYGSQP